MGSTQIPEVAPDSARMLGLSALLALMFHFTHRPLRNLKYRVYIYMCMHM